MLGKYLLITLFFTPFFGRSQSVSFPIDTAGLLKYEEIISSDFNKLQLYNNAKLFTVKEFSDSKSAIQVDDKESGKIVIKAVLNSKVNEKGLLGFQFDIWTDFVFQIDVKDNKYRYRISDLIVDFSGDAVKETLPAEELILKAEKKTKAKYKAVVYKNVEKCVNNDILVIIENLKKQMSNESDDDF